MASSKRTKLTWRVQGIHQGTTEDELLSFFAGKDQERITICSLYPDVLGQDKLVATVRFNPHPEFPLEGPKKNFHAPRDMEIDKEFDGFTTLYSPPESMYIAADIVAVTGLAGHASGSWACSEDTMWLRDFLKRDAPNARVLTYGYISNLTGDSTSISNLGDLSKRFMVDLVHVRDVTKCDQRPIIFIGHSLGCIMIKKAMTIVRESNVVSSQMPVIAIVFLAAPHRGMDVDVLRTIVKVNDPPRELIQELGQPTSSILNELNERFMRIAQEIEILACFETLETKTVVWDDTKQRLTRSGKPVLMVPKSSATQGGLREASIAARANHSDIAKLRQGGSSIYSHVSMAIKKALIPVAQKFREGGPKLESDRSGAQHRETPPPSGYNPWSSTALPLAHIGHHGDDLNQHSRQSTPPSSGHMHAPRPALSSTYGHINHVQSHDYFVNGADPRGPNNVQFGPGHAPNQASQKWGPSKVGDFASPYEPRGWDATPVQDPGRQQSPYSSFQGRASPDSGYPLRANSGQTPPAMPVHQQTSNMYAQNRLPEIDAYGRPQFQHQVPQPGLAHHISMHQLRGPGSMPYGAGLADQLRTYQKRSAQLLPEFDHMNLGAGTGMHTQPHKQHHLNQPSVPFESPYDVEESGRHPNGYCDFCEEEVIGIRYSCLQCPDWNFCSDCFRDNIGTHPKHKFQAIEPPGEESDSEDALRDYGDEEPIQGSGECLTCATVVTSPPGFFYQCHDCDDMQITCEACQKSSRSCLHHGEAAQRRRFIWYGDRQATVAYVEPDATPEDSMLVQALKREDITAVDKLVRNAQALNAVDREGRSPLHIGACLQLDTGIKFLLMHGASMEVKDQYMYTPLGQAVLCKHEATAELLLERGANPNNLQRSGNTILHLAAIAGCADLVDHLIDFGVPVDKRNWEGQTALFCCCEVGDFDLAQVLLDAGAEASMTNDRNATQIGELAALNVASAVTFLLDQGADVDSCDNLGRTILFRAATNGHFGLCRTLIQRGADTNNNSKDNDQTILGQAAGNGKITTVNVLLEAGTQVEGEDSKSRTPLFRAATTGKLNVCRALLDHKASPNTGPAYMSLPGGDEVWTTTLGGAILSGHTDIVKLLVERGADLEATDEYSRTPLFLAAEYGVLEDVKILMEAGADCDATALSETVVSIAAKYGHLEVVKHVIEEGTGEASPPPSASGGKWKNFKFVENVTYGRKHDILALLRAHKHDYT